MNEHEDIELLRQYAEEQSDVAFEMLVKRHVNLVYSAARRSVERPDDAEEITQAVFIILARKARILRQGTILSGWLYQTARLTAANFRRAEIRRAHREKEAHMQSVLNEGDADVWPQIAPLLEQAVGGLNEKDRNAIVLRFFEKKSLSEVGRAFGTSEDAAKMRVNRALEKLRVFFTKRGFTLSATVLAVAMSANSVQGAPIELATSVAAAAKGSAAALSTVTLVKGTLKLMAWTKAKFAIVAAGVLLFGGASGTLVYKKWEAYKAYHAALPAGVPTTAVDSESWRNPTNSFAAVERAAPQVKILPSKYPNAFYNLKGDPSGLKWVGIAAPVRTIAWVAYESRPARVTFDSPQPQDRYDFITSLPQDSLEALRQELKNTLGFVGHREIRETDVLLLKVQTPNAPALKPATGQGTQNWGEAGRYYCDDVPLSSTNRALQGIAQFLEQAFGKPVIDQTGLMQNFNIDLRWDARHPRKREAIQEALLNQLGLDLVPGRESVELLVLDKAQ
jgi:uncharacterized protein (TIGR03435 family)